MQSSLYLKVECFLYFYILIAKVQAGIWVYIFII